MTAMIGIAAAQGMLAGYAGLVISFHAGLPSGPLIILMAGLLYLLALVFGPAGGLLRRFKTGAAFGRLIPSAHGDLQWHM